MRNILLVMRHDILVTIRQRSFWIMTFLMPTLLILLNAYQILRDTRTEQQAGEAGAAAGVPQERMKIGLVDEAELLAQAPGGDADDLFLKFPDRDHAAAALNAGEIKQFVLIPGTFISSGQVLVYTRNYQIQRNGGETGLGIDSPANRLLQYLIDYNLTGDVTLVNALGNPTPGDQATVHVLSPPAASETQSQELAELVASLVPYIYYFLLLLGSGYLMRSVVAEKENRTAEILLLSLRPVDLLVGKILAMSVVILVQVTVWIGGGMLVLDRSAPLLNLAEFAFPPGFLIWASLFLLLGYLLFATVMAAGGAIANNAREAGQLTWLLVIPLMPTLMFGSLFLEEPTHPLTIGLSLFPFSAPSTMVTRLAVGSVPVWQIAVSLAGLAVTTYGMLRLATRYFRSRNLLSQASFNWRRLASGWRR